jgi:predicted RNA binding protein YcfA (HicA-like mRNA interferase family)
MKSRDIERQVREAGGVLHKKDGDHYVYRLPNGRLFVLPMGGAHSEAKSYLKSKLRRLLREPPRKASGE